MHETPHRGMTRLAAAMAGMVAGGVTLGVGELAGAAVDMSAAPFLAVGNAAVDLTPEWLKSLAIETFGENDKLALLIGMSVVLTVLAAVGGLLELRRRWWGVAMLSALGVVAVAAALGRPTAGLTWALPTLAGVVVGATTLHMLVKLLRIPEPDASSGEHPADRVRLPTPTDTRPQAPDGAVLDIDGVTPFRTPNAAFYRVDINLDVPGVRPDEWRLRVHGMVDGEIELTYDDLLELDLVERMITLTCVSNEVGGDLAGNARWLGHPLADLLERAGPSSDADMVLSTSVDGFTISTPLAALTDGRDALLAIGMNGEPLPVEHGFPVRMVVPGLYGYVSATKWVTDLEVTRFDQATAYWTDRDWVPRAPIKTASRIDVPGSFGELAVGENVVAGVAWAQRRGISSVEVQVDDGPWQPAELADEASVDVWRQWFWRWEATEAGNHTLRVRATDGDGQLQTEEQAAPFPEGSSGWHSVVVNVT